MATKNRGGGDMKDMWIPLVAEIIRLGREWLEKEREAKMKSGAAAEATHQKAAEAERAAQIKLLQLQLEMSKAQLKIEQLRREQLQLQLEILHATTDGERREKQATADGVAREEREREADFNAATRVAEEATRAIATKDEKKLDEMSKSLMVVPNGGQLLR